MVLRFISCAVALFTVALSRNADAACSATTRQIAYAANSSAADGSAMAEISEFARSIKSCSDQYTVRVQGYASKSEDPHLAIARAISVRDLLLKAGLPMEAVSSYGRQGVTIGSSDIESQVVSIRVEAVASAEGRMAQSEPKDIPGPSASRPVGAERSSSKVAGAAASLESNSQNRSSQNYATSNRAAPARAETGATQGQAGGPSRSQYSTRSESDQASSNAAANAGSYSYSAGQFSGLKTWAKLFQREVDDPKAASDFVQKMSQIGSGTEAHAQSLAFGSKRNDYQKLVTDHKLYAGYYPSPAKFLEKQNQCLEPRSYTPAEACDCVAGFPGDTAIGPGAGELVTQSNTKLAVAACGEAANLATNPRLKARYIAQKARAQIYTMDMTQAGRWTDEALAGGYWRAIILKANIGLREIEVLTSGFPPMTQSQFDTSLKYGVDALKAAKKAGVWETFIVAQQYQQTLHNLAFNAAILGPMIKSMMAPPPSTPCDQDTKDSNGNPIPGSGCIGHSVR